MLEILTAFSVRQIITYTIMLAFAVRGGVDFFGWCKEKYQKKFDKDHAQLLKQEMLEEHYKECSEQHQESVDRYNSLENKIDLLTETVNHKVDKLEAQLTRLTESDMHDIKGWIVEKHHELMKKQWVDDFTIETYMLKGLWKTSGHYLTFHQKIKRRNAEDQSKEILDWSRFPHI